MLRAEVRKLKRSATWLVAFVLPVLAIVTGTVNLANNPQALGRDWASLASQTTLFYGLFFCAMGVALLCATAWRTEHRGSNWQAMLLTARSPLRLVTAKLFAIMLPVAAMQAVLVLGTIAAGVLVLGLTGPPPSSLVLSGAAAVLAALPLAAAQSLLSMLMRSFAAPLALCLLGCVLGIGTILSDRLRPFGLLVPQALLSRTLTLDSVALTDPAAAGAAELLPLLGASLGLSLLLLACQMAAVRIVVLR